MAIAIESTALRVDEHGAIRVGATRVTLDLVLSAHQAGASPAEIVCRYPSLTLADVEAAIGYYLQHKPAVDAYLLAGKLKGEQMRRENEARWPAQPFRERVLARWRAKPGESGDAPTAGG